MKFLSKSTLLLVLVSSLIGCATGLEKALPDFRIRAADQADIGSYGVVIGGSGIPYRYMQQSPSRWKDIDVQIKASRIVKYNSDKKFNAELSEDSIGTLSMKTEDIKKEGFKVVIFNIHDLKSIERQLSDMPEIIAEYKENRDFRFVHSVAKVYDHNKVDKLKGNFTVRLEELQPGNNAYIELDSDESLDISYGNGDVVAYRYCRICWNKNGEIRLRVDVPDPFWAIGGLKAECSDGLCKDHPDTEKGKKCFGLD